MPKDKISTLSYSGKGEQSLNESLQQILKTAREQESISIRTLLTSLAGRGYAVLLIILSIPFCFPINIPGFSTPFGIALAFIGFRIACAKRPWWPKRVLDINIPSKRLTKLVEKAIIVVQGLRKVLYPRINILVNHPVIRRLNGILIALLAILLSFPLPIPMTNMLAALPILCFGIGKLEDDGLVILVGYVLSLLCFAYFIALYLLGRSILLHF